MPDFFDQPVNSMVPNPEPPETSLIRDLLARKSFDLQADPYGGNQMRSNQLQPAAAFTGSGGGPSQDFFYGGQGQQQPGGGGQTGPAGGPQAPRMNPIRALMAMLQRATQTVNRPSGPPAAGGSFFDRMSQNRPNQDSRGGLRALAQSQRNMQRIPSFDGGAAAYDGGQPSAQLPGFDGPGGGVWQGTWSQYDPANQNPWGGGWQNDANGMPIGPGGFQYTGSQHEFSGGMGRDARSQIMAAQAQGGPTYGQWLEEVRRRQASRPGMFQHSPGTTGQQFSGGRTPRTSYGNAGLASWQNQNSMANSNPAAMQAGRVQAAPQPPMALPPVDDRPPDQGNPGQSLPAPRVPQPVQRDAQVPQNRNPILTQPRTS